MASLVERLQWIVTADGSSAISAFKKIGDAADKELGKAEKSSKNLGSSLTKFGAVGAAAGGLLGASLIKAAGTFETLALKASKMSDATGLTVQASSRWIEVTDDMGVSSETLGTAINKMNKTLGATPQVFAQYGVAVARAKDGTVDVNQTFLNVVDRLNAIPNASDRAAAGTALLGKGWTGLAEVIKTGSAGLKQSLDSVSSAKVIDPAEAQKAKDYRAALDSLTDSIDDLVISVGQGAAPVIGAIAKTIGGAVAAFDRLDAVTGGFVGRVATIAALGVGVAGVGGVIVGQAIKITSNLTSAAGSVGKFTASLAAKKAAEAAASAATAQSTAVLSTFSTANAASIGTINARSAALAAETGVIEANTVANEANATSTLASGGALKYMIPSIGIFAAEAIHAQGAAKELSGAVGELAKSTTATSSIDAMTDAFGRFLNASLAGGDQFEQIASFAAKDVEGAQRLADAIHSGALAFDTSSTFGKHYIETLDAAIVKQTAAAEAATDSADATDDLATATSHAGSAMGVYGDELRQTVEANKIGADAEKEYAKNAKELEDVLTAAGKAQEAFADLQAADAIKAETQAFEELTGALEANKSALEGDLAAQEALASSFRDAADADVDVKDKTEAFTKSLADNAEAIKDAKKNGESLDAVYRSNAAAAAALADANVHWRTEQDATNGVVTSATAKQEAFNSSMLASAASAEGPVRDAILAYAASVNGIPPEALTEIIADVNAGDLDAANTKLNEASKARTADINADADQAALDRTNAALAKAAKDRETLVKAQADVAQFNTDLAAAIKERDTQIVAHLDHTAADNAIRALIKARDLIVNVQLKNAGGKGFKPGTGPVDPVTGRSAYAEGTPSAPPGLAWVGEEGPELIQLKGGERIWPNGQIPGYAGGAGTPINGTGSASQTYNLVIAPTQAAAAPASAAGGVDDAIKEQDRLQAALFHTNRSSLADYKQYVQGRLAASDDLSDDYLTQFDLLAQLSDIEKQTAADRVQAAKDAADAEKQAAADAIAAQDDVMKNMFALGAISLQQYEEYLTGRLGSFQAYTDGYTQIALQLKAMNEQEVADRTKTAQDAADAELAIYKQLQANKAVVDAEAEQAKQTAAVRAAGTAGSKVMNDRKATDEDRAQAVADLEDAQTKLAEDTWDTIQAKASAANLPEGSKAWSQMVRAMLDDAIRTYTANGFEVAAAMLTGDASGIPNLAAGGVVKRRPGGHLIVAGEGQHDEAVVPLDGRQFGQVTTNNTYHQHLPAGWSPTHALIATQEQAARRGYRAA